MSMPLLGMGEMNDLCTRTYSQLEVFSLVVY